MPHWGERSLARVRWLRRTLLMRSALPAAIVLAGALSAAVAQSPTPHPNSIAAQLAGPWHHVPDSVSSDRAAHDQAKCRMIAGQTPKINDIKFSVVLINCLRAEGYEPGAAKKPAVAKPAPAMKPTLADRDAAGGGVGIYPCAEFTKARETPDLEALFFTWAQGFLTGWNMGVSDDTGLSVELSKLSRDEQKQFIREYCEANPTKRYLQGVIALMAKLK
jgi:hypothetical protein